MAPTPITLVCFGLCLGLRIRIEAETLPQPSLRAQPGTLVPYGDPVTLWCRGALGSSWYFLKKKGSSESQKKAAVGRNEAEFPISSVTQDTAGSYFCFYYNGSYWSEGSEPLKLVVTGLYSKPSFSALPSSELVSGQKVTLWCQAESKFDRFVLYKEEGAKSPQTWEIGEQPDFILPSVAAAHGGVYRCYSFHSQKPLLWTAPSDPLELRVIAPQDYTRAKFICLSLAGLILFILGTFLVEA
ncbi:platelet glycoprotein VI-like [Macrotis lagotis]|uniref:platelet glycoprotein VI-like n=1 Tax=Macrotis lagotis TaxID=92651 RepID=UPI003D68C47C